MTYEIIPLTTLARDISAQTFGRLTAIARISDKAKKRVLWLCVCDCGTEHVVRADHLYAGLIRSCGCLRIESSREKETTHGLTGTSEYMSWTGAKGRCHNEQDAKYEYYGGRGISVCKRWDTFEQFLKDMGNRPTQKHSIDRIDNDGDYTPENCRWATMKEQCRNRRSNHLLTYDGETLCITEWEEKMGVSRGLIRGRVFAGWGIEDAITRPTGPQGG